MTSPSPPDAASSEATVHVVCSLFRPARRLLDRQLESILEQSHADLRVWLRDDAVDAATAATIDEWHRRDARIEPASGAPERVGTRASYGRLLRTALDHGAWFVALADQDDEWLPTHLADSLELARRAHGRKEPLLVHGDLELIDEAGVPIAPSFFAHQRIRHEPKDALNVLAVQNFVTGCATLLNRPLAELALPIPEAAIMHDWWIALCAAAAGHVVARERTTVRYRQHDRNQIGARPYADVVRDLGRRTLRMQRHSNEPLLETVRQCAALRARLAEREGDRLPGATAERVLRAEGLLDRYLSLYRPGVSRLRRAFGLLQLGIGRQDALLDLSLKSKLLTTPVAIEPETRSAQGADAAPPADG